MLMKRLTLHDINAYLDGALSDEARAEVEAALTHDPAARAMVERFRRQADELHRIYDGVLDEPIPDRMMSLLRGTGRPS